MQPKTKLALLFAFGALVVVWGGVAWRLWKPSLQTVQGQLRVGSLRCDDPCHFQLVIESHGGTRVRVAGCGLLPDTLRDAPGVVVVAAGDWEGERRFKAQHLFAHGAKAPGAPLRPAACVPRP